MNPFRLFNDPILQAPLIGTILMSLSSSIMGVLMFVKKKSLVGEALSHAAYPGIILGIVVASCCSGYSDEVASWSILFGALLSCLVGAFLIESLIKKLHIHPDAALCYVLSAFLGLGVTLASLIQKSHALWYRKIQMFFYGQAITMSMIHVHIYLIFGMLILLFVVFFYTSIKAYCFDRDFSKISGLPIRFLNGAITFLLSLSIVIGIRSIGVVLMTAMLVAPAIAARQLSQSLSRMFFLAVIFGAISAFLGVYFSITLGEIFFHKALPTGPSIVLVSSCICLLSLVFSPKSGVLIRQIRRYRFVKKCLIENFLKGLWKKGPDRSLTFKQILALKLASPMRTRLAMISLHKQGWVQGSKKDGFKLSRDGEIKAAYVIRLHRLWEVYLADHLGFKLDEIHHNAEEMEHIITPDVELALTQMLLNPTQDPHHQPIPQKEYL